MFRPFGSNTSNHPVKLFCVRRNTHTSPINICFYYEITASVLTQRTKRKKEDNTRERVINCLAYSYHPNSRQNNGALKVYDTAMGLCAYHKRSHLQSLQRPANEVTTKEFHLFVKRNNA